MQPKKIATGHPLELAFERLVPGQSYSVKLSGGNFFTGHVDATAQEQPLPTLSKYEFGFTASASEVRYVVGVALVRGLITGAISTSGQDASHCHVRMHEARWSGQGEFVIDTGGVEAPPTCANLGCGPENPLCPPPYKGCYGYMGVFWCCIDPPYSGEDEPKP